MTHTTTIPSRPQRALSVRQPWAELILRGDKTIECRSRPTRIRERVWLYAARGRGGNPQRRSLLENADLPRGVLVGSVEIVACRPLRRSDAAAACLATDFEGYAWLLAAPNRLSVPRAPIRHPQPTFFYPFGPFGPSGSTG